MAYSVPYMSWLPPRIRKNHALEKALLAWALRATAAALSSAGTSMERAWSWGDGTDDGGVEAKSEGELGGELDLSDMK